MLDTNRVGTSVLDGLRRYNGKQSIPAHSLTDSSQTVSDILSQCQLACMHSDLDRRHAFIGEYACMHARRHACMLSLNGPNPGTNCFTIVMGISGRRGAQLRVLLFCFSSIRLTMGCDAYLLYVSILATLRDRGPRGLSASLDPAKATLPRNSATQPVRESAIVGERRRARETPRRNSPNILAFLVQRAGISSETVLRRAGRNRAYQARRRRRPAKISVLSSQKRTADHRPARLTSALEACFHWFADPCDTFSSHYVSPRGKIETKKLKVLFLLMSIFKFQTLG
jgi:hypothetical protein